MSQSRRPEKTETNRALAFYEEYFSKNPEASIDMAAKAADDAGAPIIKEIASAARRKVLEAQRIKLQIVPNMTEEKKPFVPPAKWSMPKQPVETPKATEMVQPEEPKKEEPKEEDDLAARKKFVNDLIEKDPGIKPVIIQARMVEKFGKGMDSRYIYDCCRVAREMHGLPQIPYRVDPDGRASPGAGMHPDLVAEAVRDFVGTLKAAGLRFESFVLSINSDYEAEFTYERKISNSGKVKL